MAVRVIYGRAGSGKTQQCLNEIKAQQKSGAGGPLIMMVPEQFSYRTEKGLCGAMGVVGAQTAEVLTFSRLAQRIFAAMSGAAKNTLSAAGKSMLIYRALYQKKNQLAVFGASAEKAGFLDRIEGLIAELKRYGVSPSELRERAQPGTDALFAAKLYDLAAICECYDELLSPDYVDAQDNLYRAAALLARSDYLSGAQIWIDEFSDFLPQHYAMLEALAKRADKVTVCLCCDEHRRADGLFSPAAATFSRLEHMCARLGIPFNPPLYLAAQPAYAHSRELAFLERSYADYAAAPFENKTQDISLFEAENAFGEIQQCARRILALCRDQGYRFRDIAVACGSMEGYGEVVSEVFLQSGIPYFLSEKSAVSEHPLVLAILSALDVFLKNWDYDSVFAHFKSGFSLLSQGETDLLENYVLAAGIRGKAWTQEQDWHYRVALFDDADGVWQQETLARVNALRRKGIAPLIRLREGIGSGKTVKESCAAVFAFMGELKLFDKVSAFTEQFKAEGRLSLANLYGRVWNSVMEVLDQLVLIAGDERLGLQAFRGILAAGFAKQQSGIIPQSVDQVIVTDILNSRTCDCRALFILGANSGYFPGVSAAEGILSDDERTALSQQGTGLAPTARQKVFDERFLIYKALTKPTCRLYISYSLSDMEGRALMPSPVADHVRKLFPAMTITSEAGAGDETELIAAPDAAFDALALRFGRLRAGGCSGLWADVLSWYENNPAYRQRCENLYAALSYTNLAKPVSPALIFKAYSGVLNTSVSRLEKYRACPYSYFVSFALKAKERKILKISPPDIGLMTHKVLELLTKRVIEQGISWHGLDEAWCASAVDEIVDGLAAELFSDSMLAADTTAALIARFKRTLVRCVLLLAEHISRGGFEPVGSEIRFGDGSQLPCVEIDLGIMGKVRINGVIDRLDTCETPQGIYYRVIDYKSGNKRFKLSNILNLLDLQLMVYMDAAAPVRTGAKPAGILYFRVLELLVRSDARPDEQALERELKKQMKPDGLLLAEPDVIRAMDPSAGDESDILPVKFLKDGAFAASASVATARQFSLLRDYVRSGIAKLGRDILSGRIDIKPCRENGAAPCAYCAYAAICKFRPQDGYNELESRSAQKAWAELAQWKEAQPDGD